ncbi:NAD(P)/FAD-dependent oxidoreductase [Donghicola tyrosinivorans]|uniref:D-amino-acid dehydrogenase n=1 Tax=Donghicola tyrosinivorans TaxID=1652492 RepID=A0A2T0WJH0_9RHOB|nr:FAD-binding oxidoreductase [Donghicola tyrosinivorans]PRY86863.1 D-amino-acid dehydrogenase [Donghicola tyrosinivorans]
MAQVLVLGAGMVGVSTALALQERGHEVCLIDRREAGRETSYGNAGYIQGEASEPYALPRDLKTLTQFALGLRNDVMWSFAGVSKMVPALWSYYRYSRPDRHRAVSQVYTRLTTCAPAAHAPLIEAAGAGNLITKAGYYQIHRDPSEFAAMARDAERLEREYGVKADFLDTRAFRRAEPVLKGDVAGAIHWQATMLCADPGGLVQAYAELFKARGGVIRHGDALSLRQSGAGWQVQTEDGLESGTAAVVALGPWSPEVLARFGYRVQMVYKRGYHAHYRMEQTLNASIMDADNAVVLTPMRKGLRLATGAALVGRKGAVDTRQITRGAKGVSDIIDLGPRVDEPQWSGTRPCMPDMLPVVGEAPRHKGLWCHFGHGHQGFTLGPVTAGLLAAQMDGADSDLARALAVPRPGVFH